MGRAEFELRPSLTLLSLVQTCEQTIPARVGRSSTGVDDGDNRGDEDDDRMQTPPSSDNGWPAVMATQRPIRQKRPHTRQVHMHLARTAHSWSISTTAVAGGTMLPSPSPPLEFRMRGEGVRSVACTSTMFEREAAKGLGTKKDREGDIQNVAHSIYQPLFLSFNPSKCS
ncbi:hypothetical protein GALMADRAFT_216559 [Galerina marginata CBS 339.88]|uniref:Uncharacterized protein n=1 Tax=Galerina marginata (strain CBS 339.88) TaxID=685588 RepID=A0A067S8V6_GALM3|nr:hypothetical protein GALMADRAFT_216559 [Galerina marginata CBS 339.88]